MRVASCPACPKCPGPSPHRICGTAQRRDSFLLPILNHKNPAAAEALAVVREAGRAEALVAGLAGGAAGRGVPGGGGGGGRAAPGGGKGGTGGAMGRGGGRGGR